MATCTKSDNFGLDTRWFGIYEKYSLVLFVNNVISMYELLSWLLIADLENQRAKLENCGPPPGNNLKVGQGQGHGMVPNEWACHKDQAYQILMLYH